MVFFRLVTVRALTLTTALVSATLAAAQEQAWVQIESYPSEETARSRAAAYAGEFPNVQVFSGGAWHAIVLGPYAPEEAAGALTELRRAGRVPGDAFVTDGAKFEAPDLMAAPVAPEATAEPEVVVAPTEVADETVPEARASEAALSRDDRMALQQALQWYGFYDSAIDGAFGSGTRNSMAAWQEASGFEPTGILTSHQRATLVANHAADLAEFGFETVTEPEAGIEITLPLALVAFDHYEPPFVHFGEKDGSGLRVMLISEPGGVEALAGLYDVLQTLEAVPETGPRERKEKSFRIEGVSDKVQSLAFAETRDGMVKGYLAVWTPADAAQMERILPVLQASFRAVGDKALDPGLVPMDEATRAGMLSGLELRQPRSVASGFFVDDMGHVATSLANVAGCARVTLGLETEAEVAATDDAAGLALLAARSPMAPQAVAHLASASPVAGVEVAVAGYSYGERLPAPVLTFGSLEAAEGLTGEPGFLRIVAPLMAGDMGGPVLDGAGKVLGIAVPVPEGSARLLPQGMALAADGGRLATLLQGAGIVAATPVAETAALSPDALNAAALGMTVQVACWEN
ncbi:peptidoglycan-binding protein [Tabrizicola oligotrophica]|uniref:Peptidoglycan-binding protein n=1 Tax=Tabrizicola oligotrophica TaxID=2710650 RepID=A0A6M0QW07_9RHOB|nr:peptidoglycan-binding protein [Tabrizicola oligotrophica]NEY90672.1 peptidoglycan-binding protein [Tabrizicola oligotrophica]